MSIVIKKLTHVYMPGSPFETTAVRNVSVTIGDGEFIGIIGPTGSGKSTLVQHINGLLKPTSGSLTVEGVDVTARGADLRQLRRKVGLVFQYPEYQISRKRCARMWPSVPGTWG
jgi:energy-coupling factor transport system ATP-binding protein